MATAASGSSAYCTVTQFLQRYDTRSVRELLSDTGTAVSTSAVADDTTLAALLKEASGEVEAAACAGQRYVINSSQNDLSSLTNNSAAFLAGMVAHLTMYRLWCRRPAMMANVPPPPLYDRAQEFLEQLRLGERVFGILENHEAAALDADQESQQDVEDRQGVVFNAARLFGTRVNRSRV